MELLKEKQGRFVILDTGQMVNQFRQELETMEYVSHTADAALERIFACLREEGTAEMELGFLCLEAVSARSKTRNRQKREEIDRYVQASEWLGLSLLHQLKLMRMYRNGFMPFHYVGCSVNDVVLMLPETDDIPFRRLRNA